MNEEEEEEKKKIKKKKEKKTEKKSCQWKRKEKKSGKQIKNFYICLTIQFQNRMVLKTICQLPTNPIDVIFHFFW